VTSPLESVIAKAKEASRAGDAPGAMNLALDLIRQFPNEKRVWAFRAHLLSLGKQYEAAISDLTSAISIAPNDPYLFFFRGDCQRRLGRISAAIPDFTEGLAVCDRENDAYYRETLLFFRAEALISTGRKEEAIDDLSRVQDDFQFWTDRLYTKADLLALAGRL
jgi:tetratricopeptide (TPR) repeat protein